MFMLMYKVYSIRISGDSFWQNTRRANVEGECDLPPDNNEPLSASMQIVRVMLWWELKRANGFIPFLE